PLDQFESVSSWTMLWWMPCIRGVTMSLHSQRSTSQGNWALEWWNMISISASVCQTDSDSGDAPTTTTWAALQGTDRTISAKWKRTAVEASRSRSTWWTWWNRHRKGTLWTRTCQM